MTANIKFARVRPDAIVPSKRDEDAGFDIYANFEEDFIEIAPNETKLIPTNIASSCDPGYCFLLRERGSTGSKGIALRCGVIDSGFRSPWFVALTNVSNKFVLISKLSDKETFLKAYPEGWHVEDHTTGEEIARYELLWDTQEKEIRDIVTFYPYSKAIAQALVVPVPEVNVEEISLEELQNIPSERGCGSLGSSNK